MPFFGDLVSLYSLSIGGPEVIPPWRRSSQPIMDTLGHAACQHYTFLAPKSNAPDFDKLFTGPELNAPSDRSVINYRVRFLRTDVRSTRFPTGCSISLVGSASGFLHWGPWENSELWLNWKLFPVLFRSCAELPPGLNIISLGGRPSV